MEEPTLLGRLNDGRELPCSTCTCGHCGNEWFMASISDEWMPSFCPYCGIEFKRRTTDGKPAEYTPHARQHMLDAALDEIIRLKSAWCDSLGIPQESSSVAMMIESHRKAECGWVTADKVTYDSTDIWFWWNGEQSFPVSIMRDIDGRFFASAGQWGWSVAQFVDDMKGLWFPCLCPVPGNSDQDAA